MAQLPIVYIDTFSKDGFELSNKDLLYEYCIQLNNKSFDWAPKKQKELFKETRDYATYISAIEQCNNALDIVKILKKFCKPPITTHKDVWAILQNTTLTTTFERFGDFKTYIVGTPNYYKIATCLFNVRGALNKQALELRIKEGFLNELSQFTIKNTPLPDAIQQNADVTTKQTLQQKCFQKKHLKWFLQSMPLYESTYENKLRELASYDKDSPITFAANATILQMESKLVEDCKWAFVDKIPLLFEEIDSYLRNQECKAIHVRFLLNTKLSSLLNLYKESLTLFKANKSQINLSRNEFPDVETVFVIDGRTPTEDESADEIEEVHENDLVKIQHVAEILYRKKEISLGSISLTEWENLVNKLYEIAKSAIDAKSTIMSKPISNHIKSNEFQNIFNYANGKGKTDYDTELIAKLVLYYLDTKPKILDLTEDYKRLSSDTEDVQSVVEFARAYKEASAPSFTPDITKLGWIGFVKNVYSETVAEIDEGSEIIDDITSSRIKDKEIGEYLNLKTGLGKRDIGRTLISNLVEYYCKTQPNDVDVENVTLDDKLPKAVSVQSKPNVFVLAILDFVSNFDTGTTTSFSDEIKKEQWISFVTSLYKHAKQQIQKGLLKSKF